MNTDFIHVTKLSDIAVGLNIEGYEPSQYLPPGCKWYNIIQVIDEPLDGITFDYVMQKVKKYNYEFIEQAIGINIDDLLNKIVTFIEKIKPYHKNLLVHVHQYTGTTMLHKAIEDRTGIKAILDVTNFYDNPIDYAKDYPDIDGLISLSQCAGFNVPAGSWIIPTSFMVFDVVHNIIYTKKLSAKNDADKYFTPDQTGNILMVNDLWNPMIVDKSKLLSNPDSDDDSEVDIKNTILLFDEKCKHVYDVILQNLDYDKNRITRYLNLMKHNLVMKKNCVAHLVCALFMDDMIDDSTIIKIMKNQ